MSIIIPQSRRVNLYMTANTREHLVAMAKQQRRSMSDVIRYLVAKEAEEMGLPPISQTNTPASQPQAQA